jgi:hypothetical protein
VHFGTEAVYRVCDWDDELAEVEVVKAPGLERGRRFKFDRATVANMMVVASPVDQAGPPADGR